VPLPFSNVRLCVGLLVHLLMWKDAPSQENETLKMCKNIVRYFPFSNV
jgi:hypothetical protein